MHGLELWAHDFRVQKVASWQQASSSLQVTVFILGAWNLV